MGQNVRATSRDRRPLPKRLSRSESPLGGHDQCHVRCSDVSVSLAELRCPAAWKWNPQHGHSYANKSTCFTAASPRWSNIISAMDQPWGPDFHLTGQPEAALGCMLPWGDLCYSSVMWLSPLQPQQKGGERGIGLMDLSWRCFLDSLCYSDRGVTRTKKLLLWAHSVSVLRPCWHSSQQGFSQWEWEFPMVQFSKRSEETYLCPLQHSHN